MNSMLVENEISIISPLYILFIYSWLKKYVLLFIQWEYQNMSNAILEKFLIE